MSAYVIRITAATVVVVVVFVAVLVFCVCCDLDTGMISTV